MKENEKSSTEVEMNSSHVRILSLASYLLVQLVQYRLKKIWLMKTSNYH